MTIFTLIKVYLCNVKKTLRLIVFTSFLVLYCFVMSLYSNNAFIENSSFSKPSNSENRQYYFSTSLNSIYHIANTENFVNFFDNVSTSSPKNSFNKISVLVKITEQLFFNRFTQYSFESLNLLINLQQTNLIFPFHYFW